GNPDIDELLVIDTKKWRRNINLKTFSEARAFVRKMREKRFDIAIDLQGLVKSGVIARLSGAKKIIGFDKANLRESANALFTNTKVGPGPGRHHVVDICLSLLKPLNLKRVEHSFFFICPLWMNLL
ncbi:MAG: glycosyltransferase family 9 protein, partial [Nitrospinota bacterium]